VCISIRIEATIGRSRGGKKKSESKATKNLNGRVNFKCEEEERREGNETRLIVHSK
jgi:hypothetical protein